MTGKIEVEQRGPLTRNEFVKIKSFLDKNAKFILKKERLSFMYFRDKIPKDVEEIKDDPIDLRIRVTNKDPEIIIKYGLFGRCDNRKEISLPIPLDKVEEAVELLKAMGWVETVAYATKTYTYQYRGIEFALVEIKNFGYTYEAEILVEEGKNIEGIRDKIKSVCKELSLRDYKKGEFENQCNKINNTKSLQFNFSKIDFKKTKKIFEDFF